VIGFLVPDVNLANFAGIYLAVMREYHPLADRLKVKIFTSTINDNLGAPGLSMDR
jgi:hypothetical protein